MTDTNKVILYHAGWCPPCKHFTRHGGEWDQIKNKINTMKQTSNIDYEEYQFENDGDKFEQAGIKSYPTLKILNNGKVTNFEGDRTNVDEVISTVMGTNFQLGGSNKYYKINYKAKYLKYKTKYLKLKRSL